MLFRSAFRHSKLHRHPHGINSLTRRSIMSHPQHHFALPDFECERRPHETTVQFQQETTTTRQDPYHWLRNRQDEDVMQYITLENQYQEQFMQHTLPLQKKLYGELLARMKQDDTTVPVRRGDYLYFSKNLQGKQYKVYYRRELSEELKMEDSIDFEKDAQRMHAQTEEQVLLDLNQIVESEKLDFLDLGVFEVSPDGQWLCYGLDREGDEIFTLYFKNLNTGEVLEEVIHGAYYSVQWVNASTHVYYTILNESLRPYRVYLHRIGSGNGGKDSGEDKQVLEERDEKFFVSLDRTQSDHFVYISLDSNVTSEIHVIDANVTEESDMDHFRMVVPRKHGVEYALDHHGDHFYIVENARDAANFRLVRTPTDTPSIKPKQCEEVLAYNERRRVNEMVSFQNHLAIHVREQGLPKLIIMDPNTREFHHVEFPDATYSMHLGQNDEFNTQWLRITYSSFKTPRSTFYYNMNTREMVLKKEDPVLGDYDRAQYTDERIVAKSRDGTDIPVSLIYRTTLANDEKFEFDGSRPALLEGYGSYGINNDASFSRNILSLLDRGFVYAIAHIRGGEENGRTWYHDGKFLKKKNTFFDFIDSAKHLINKGYTSRDTLAIVGGSAGGLLIGACVNEEPDLFRAAILEVPFVDVVNTMLDSSIPLTEIEFDEWGNPKDKEYYDYMMTYSPYDNIDSSEDNVKRKYPAILVESGLSDPRVQYWEPTKYTAKLRHYYRNVKHNDDTTDRVLLKTHMSQGHMGASGRFDNLKEIAYRYAFLLDTLQME